MCFFFFFQAEDGIRDTSVTGVQTCALPISRVLGRAEGPNRTFVLPFHTCHLEVNLWWAGIFERFQQRVPLLVAPIRPLPYSGMPQMPAIPIQRVAPQCSKPGKLLREVSD